MTRLASCCSKQSVNPPVDAPTSTHSFPATISFQCSSARSSFSPPRLTYLKSSPSRRIAQSSSIGAPAFSIFCSLTSTLPARISACARSRDAARPRFTRSLSSLDFTEIFFCAARKCQHLLQCNLLKHLPLNHLRRYFAPFAQNFP